MKEYTEQDKKLEKLLNKYLLESKYFLTNEDEYKERIEGTIENAVERHVKRLTNFTVLLHLKSQEEKFEICHKLKLAIQTESCHFLYMLSQHRYEEARSIMNDCFEYLEQLPAEIFNQTKQIKND